MIKHYISSETRNIRWILCLSRDNVNYELVLEMKNSVCITKLNKVVTFSALTHVPKDRKAKIYLDSLSYHASKYLVFGPNYLIVYEELFLSTHRGFEDKPIWIFQGPSALGKSYLAHRLEDMKIFETDSYDVLPEEIVADVVVLGNKHKYSYEDISSRVKGKIIRVSFQIE